MKTLDRRVAHDVPPPSRVKRGRRRRTWRRVLLVTFMVIALVVVALGVSVLAYMRSKFNEVAEVSKPVQAATHLLAPPTAGRPAIALIIGTDLRPTAHDFGRSDTLILVRVDPKQEVISTMSIPRSTQVEIEGVGPDLINAAYAFGGPTLALKTVTELTGLQVNYLVVVDFQGFRDVVDAFGGLYIDVDHRYFYDGPGGSLGYQAIDLQPGYQRLNGQQALAFARDRHADSDYYRIARQQMVIQEMRRMADEVGGSPSQLFIHFSKVLSLMRAVAGSTDVGAAEGKLKFSTAVSWARTIQGIPESRLVTVPVKGSDSDSLQQSLQQFLNPVREAPEVPHVGAGGTQPPPDPDPNATPGPLGNATVAPDEEFARDAFEAMAGQTAIRVQYPTVREIDSVLEGDPVVYDIDTGDGLEPAYRATFRSGNGLEFWGIQATKWTDAPILRDPSRTEKRGGREYRFYFNGGRLHMVAFQEGDTVYWVSNTLFDHLSNATMVAIARSLRPV